MRPTHALALGLVLTGALNGCAGLGEGDFACPGYPSKPLCLSTAEVYRLTDGYALPRPVPKPPTSNGAPRPAEEVFLETFR
jgi:hypothetical protein